MSDLNDLNMDMEVGAAFDEYEKPSNDFRPVDPGEYSLIRNGDTEMEWHASDKGNVYANLKFLVQGGDFNGRTIFDTISTYVGKFRKASSVQDFLAACGYDGEPENGSRFTVQEIIDAVNQTFGPFTAYVDWQGYCPNCDKTAVKSSKFFPRDEDGKLLHTTECPECGGKVVARARVKRFIVE
jgi:hypothetical protein